MVVKSRANSSAMVDPRRLGAERVASMLERWDADGGPLYAQLADALARLVDNGVIRGGDVLPPERKLASVLAVSRGTVVSAYSRLAERDIVRQRQGSGTTVHGEVRPTGPVPHIGEPLFASTPRSIDLLVASPPALSEVIELVDGVRLAYHSEVLDDHEPAGIPALRRRIAEHMTRTGLPTDAAQILVTAGAQQAAALVASLLVHAGDVVLCEAATWPGLVDSVQRVGGRVHGVPMDTEGVIVDELRGAIERFRPALVALNPHHQNPTGARMTEARRRQVVEVAEAYDVPLLEDRVVAHLAFDRTVPKPLAAEGSPAGYHFTVDSIDKVAWPGLRIGWVRAESQEIARLRLIRAISDLYSPIHAQLAAVELLDQFDRIVELRIAQLVAGCDALLGALDAELPDWRPHRPRGGMSVWAELPGGGAAAFCDHAARYGVRIASGREFNLPAALDTHVRLPFTAPVAHLDEAVHRLREAWSTFDTNATPTFARPGTLV